MHGLTLQANSAGMKHSCTDTFHLANGMKWGENLHSIHEMKCVGVRMSTFPHFIPFTR